MNIMSKIRVFRYKHAGDTKRAELLTKTYGVKIGKGGEIQKNVTFGSEPYLITLGDNIRLTNGVKFCTHDGGMWVIRNLGLNPNADVFGQITVGNNVHIGWNSTIMPNVKIGDNVIIGCGSVVTHDIPDNSVAAGVPARVIRDISSYFEKNKDKILNTKGMSHEDKMAIVLNSINK